MNIYNKTDKNHVYSDITFIQITDIKKKYINLKIGFTCSAFDILHAGHILMLEDAKKKCDVLVVGLHKDPNTNRNYKNKPVQDIEERTIQLNGCKYVDEIIRYSTESDLYNILINLSPDVRVLGSDWRNKEYTGYKLPIKIHWHERMHDYSTSNLRKRIIDASKETF
jgi:glycerol-3-phosphate cytidylyltransferase